MKKISIFLSLTLSAFVSCKKSDTTCTATAANLAGSYKVSSATYKLNSSTPAVDFLDGFFSEACEKDDIMALNANGTYTITDAGVTCAPVGGGSGSWSVTGNTFIQDGDSTTIQSFNCKSLVMTYSDFLSPGDIVTLSLAKQ